MATKINVGIVGGGHGGLELYNLFSHSSAVSMRFICDRNLDAPAVVAAAQDGVKTYTDLDQALAEQVDFVIEATGNAKVVSILTEKLSGTQTRLVPGEVANFLFQVVRTLRLGEDMQKDRYLTFGLDNMNCAIDIAAVTEIIGFKKSTVIPRIERHFKGVINLRGSVIPVMDVGLRFGKSEVVESPKTCVIIVNHNDKRFGLLVDRVSEVAKIPQDQISVPPMIKDANAPEDNDSFVKGLGKVGNDVKVILDLEKLLN